MLTVEKAVLQIMDGTSDLCVISQKEMDLNDPETRGFLEKHMGRILTDPAGREGQFWNDSGFAATMQRYNIGEIPVVEFAGVVGSACYESFRQLDKAEGADLVLAQFNQDGRSLIALMLLGHKSAYTHQALTEDGALSNQLLRHQAILPGPGRSWTAGLWRIPSALRCALPKSAAAATTRTLSCCARRCCNAMPPPAPARP